MCVGSHPEPRPTDPLSSRSVRNACSTKGSSSPVRLSQSAASTEANDDKTRMSMDSPKGAFDSDGTHLSEPAEVSRSSALPPNTVDQRLRDRVHPKEGGNLHALGPAEWLLCTYPLWVGSTGVDEINAPSRANGRRTTERQALSENDCVRRVTVLRFGPRDVAIVEGTWQRIDEVDGAIVASLDEAPARNIDDHGDWFFGHRAPRTHAVATTPSSIR